MALFFPDIHSKNLRLTAGERRFASLGIKATGRSTILKVNYRNTIEALDFSYQFLSAYIDEASGTEEAPLIHPDAGGRRFSIQRMRAPDPNRK